MLKVKVLETVIKEFQCDTNDLGVALSRISDLYARGESGGKPCGISYKVLYPGFAFRSAEQIPDPVYDI